jgi:hypothetical protein
MNIAKELNLAIDIDPDRDYFILGSPAYVKARSGGNAKDVVVDAVFIDEFDHGARVMGTTWG